MLRFMGEMVRQSDIVDIIELTPNEVIAKVNTATDTIVRSGSIDAQTLYDIADIIPTIRDEWRSTPIRDRGVIFTEPVSGEYPVVAIQRKGDGNYKFDYDDIPV